MKRERTHRGPVLGELLAGILLGALPLPIFTEIRARDRRGADDTGHAHRAAKQAREVAAARTTGAGRLTRGRDGRAVCNDEASGIRPMRRGLVLPFAVLACLVTSLQHLGCSPDPSGPEPDTDGDGLVDREELNVTHTSPVMADTDGDGLSDYDTSGNFNASYLGTELTLDFATLRRGVNVQDPGKRISLFVLLPPQERGPAVVTASFGAVWY